MNFPYFARVGNPGITDFVFFLMNFNCKFFFKQGIIASYTNIEVSLQKEYCNLSEEGVGMQSFGSSGARVAQLVDSGLRSRGARVRIPVRVNNRFLVVCFLKLYWRSVSRLLKIRRCTSMRTRNLICSTFFMPHIQGKSEISHG
jgi:hypothetical protein